MHSRCIELAGEIDISISAYVLQNIADSLDEDGKPWKGSRYWCKELLARKINEMSESRLVELMGFLQGKRS